MGIAAIKKRFDNTSIKWKIFAVLISFCTILLVLLWLFQVVFLDSFYKHIKISTVKKSANSIVQNIDNEHLQELVEQISFGNEVCVDIRWQNGEKRVSSDALRGCLIHRMPNEERFGLFQKTLENGGELLGYYNYDSFRLPNFDTGKFKGPFPKVEHSPQQTIIFSKVMEDQNGESVFIMINALVSPVDATVATLRTQFYYIAGFMLLFATLLALVISKWVSSPIEAINRSAKELATGDYDVHFSGSGYREINELSTTLNYAAQELSKVDGLRQELIANISHDLRTPLTLISGYAEVMRDLPDENTPENAQIIIDEAQRLSTLVNDVLDLSKLQSGMQSVNLTDYNLTDSLSGAVLRMNELLRKDGYSLEFSYDQPVWVHADQTRIHQVFYNLLTNAINYTGEDKKIYVEQSAAGEWVTVRVRDTGEGVSPENLPYIWDRYYKVDKTHKRAVTGTGLGLSIVKSVLELHGGRYGVESTPGGSTFWFQLKTVPPQEEK